MKIHMFIQYSKKSSSCINNCFTNVIDCNPGVVPTCIADHDGIFVTFNINSDFVNTTHYREK